MRVGAHQIFFGKIGFELIATAIFSKNDVTFAMTSPEVQILYRGSFFDTES